MRSLILSEVKLLLLAHGIVGAWVLGDVLRACRRVGRPSIWWSLRLGRISVLLCSAVGFTGCGGSCGCSDGHICAVGSISAVCAVTRTDLSSDADGQWLLDDPRIQHSGSHLTIRVVYLDNDRERCICLIPVVNLLCQTLVI